MKAKIQVKVEKVQKPNRKKFPQKCINCNGNPEIEELKLEGYKGTKCVKMIPKLGKTEEECCLEILTHKKI